jgi:hypothetical protein
MAAALRDGPTMLGIVLIIIQAAKDRLFRGRVQPFN